jgi:hypothetical protein
MPVEADLWFDEDGWGHRESLLVEDLGGGRYRLHEFPVLTDAASYLDVVEAEQRTDGALPRTRLLLSPAAATSGGCIRRAGRGRCRGVAIYRPGRGPTVSYRATIETATSARSSRVIQGRGASTGRPSRLASAAIRLP